MNIGASSSLCVFDPAADYSVVERDLPHWLQAGAVTFITFRTYDSMPREVVEGWHKERMAWLRIHAIDPTASNWQAQFRQLEVTGQQEYHQTFSTRWHEELDRCHGECVLRNPEYSAIVGRSLQHFDGERYELTDYVVMPNHVHLMAAFFEEDEMLAQCTSWKRFTANELNRNLGRKGRFWQQDGFDHLVRSVEQFEALRKYIAANPVQASLKDGEYLHDTKQLQ